MVVLVIGDKKMKNKYDEITKQEIEQEKDILKKVEEIKKSEDTDKSEF